MQSQCRIQVKSKDIQIKLLIIKTPICRRAPDQTAAEHSSAAQAENSDMTFPLITQKSTVCILKKIRLPNPTEIFIYLFLKNTIQIYSITIRFSNQYLFSNFIYKKQFFYLFTLQLCSFNFTCFLHCCITSF